MRPLAPAHPLLPRACAPAATCTDRLAAMTGTVATAALTTTTAIAGTIELACDTDTGYSSTHAHARHEPN
jgi:hypothetical protein